MTIVVAMKFSDRVCVLSDTMISNREGTGNNVIPGRLKSIVINKWLTISYAGLSTQAIDTVREIYRSENIKTEAVIHLLAEVSRLHDGELDFIVCSHEQSVRMVKIANGKIFEGGDAYWIGNSQAAAELSKIELPNTKCVDLPEYITADELIFKSSFQEFMRSNRCEGIGGAVIDCLCSPYGHCYNSHAGAFSWDTIVLGEDDPVQRKITEKTGMYHYAYNVCSTIARGQAIVGFYLGQSGVGFIYDPIHYDEARRVDGCSMSEFSSFVEDAGKVLAERSHNKNI